MMEQQLRESNANSNVNVNGNGHQLYGGYGASASQQQQHGGAVGVPMDVLREDDGADAEAMMTSRHMTEGERLASARYLAASAVGKRSSSTTSHTVSTGNAAEHAYLQVGQAQGLGLPRRSSFRQTQTQTQTQTTSHNANNGDASRGVNQTLEESKFALS